MHTGRPKRHPPPVAKLSSGTCPRTIFISGGGFSGAVSCDPFMSLVGLMNGLPGDVGATGTVATHDALYEQLWHNDLRLDPDTQTGTERRPQIHPHARMITDTRYLS